MKKILLLIGVFFVLLYPGYAQEYVMFGTDADLSMPSPPVDIAGDLFGLSGIFIDVGQDIPNHLIIEKVLRSSAEAVVITASALSHIDLREIISGVNQEDKSNLTFLCMGMNPEMDSRLLQSCTQGLILRCETSGGLKEELLCEIGPDKNIARELAGQKIPFSSDSLHYLIPDKKMNHQTLISVRNVRKEESLPIFMYSSLFGHDVFYLADMPLRSRKKTTDIRSGNERFTEILPILIYFKYTCSDRCWHAPEQFANLTIDDPWLTEPYGNLSYTGLLSEMKLSNFHTTIAFIPWNYDRSKPEVIDCFKQNPTRLSLCIHGNNHDHYEFYGEKNPRYPWPQKTLETQEANIRQALGRMEKFKQLTGLDYDRVMVFPHGIAPEKTLGLLKKYNFLSTVNSTNIPLDSERPDISLFDLKNISMDFRSFPSMRRSIASVPEYMLAVDIFLDNPLLFYCHHDFFQKGSDVFNETAGMVNRMKTGIKWSSLGYISRHYTLERRRDDGNYDVVVFSNNTMIKNHHEETFSFFVRKKEDFSIPIRGMVVDGNEYPYEKGEHELSFRLEIPAGESREVYIEYENDLEIESVDITKSDPRINKLRKISDFRDITLSRSFVGRLIINVYYDSGIYKWSRGKKIFVFVLFLIVMSFALFGFIQFRRKRKYKRGEEARSSP